MPKLPLEFFELQLHSAATQIYIVRHKNGILTGLHSSYSTKHLKKMHGPSRHNTAHPHAAANIAIAGGNAWKYTENRHT